MIGQRASGEHVDLGGVARDDLLLDLLGSRLEVSEELRTDRVVVLLRALTADVDEGLAELLDRPVQERVAPVSVSRTAEPPTGPDGLIPPLARRHSARAGALALVVGAALSVGGVSAAVTGDPLAGYRAIAGAAGLVADPGQPERSGQSGRIAEAHQLARQLDEAAARVAADARGAAGLVGRLEARLRDADLTEQQRLAFERQLARLKERLAAAQGRDNRPEPRGGQGGGAVERDDQGGTGTGSGGTGSTGGGSDREPATGRGSESTTERTATGDAVTPSGGQGKGTSKGRIAGSGSQSTSDKPGGGNSRR